MTRVSRNAANAPEDRARRDAQERAALPSCHFEPVLVEVASYVEASIDGLVIEVWSDKFSTWVTAQFLESEESE